MTKKQSPLLRIRDYFLLPLVLAAILLIANQVTVMGLNYEASYMSLFDRNFFTFLPLSTIGFSIGINKKNLLIIFSTSLLVTLYISGHASFLTSLHVMAGGWLLLRFLELKFNMKLVERAFMILIGFTIGLVLMTFK